MDTETAIMSESSLQECIEYQAAIVIEDEAKIIANKFSKGVKQAEIFDQQITYKKSRRDILIEKLKDRGYTCYYKQDIPKHSSRTCCFFFKLKNYHTLPTSRWYVIRI